MDPDTNKTARSSHGGRHCPTRALPPRWGRRTRLPGTPPAVYRAAARRTGAVGAQNHEPARRFGLSRKIPRVLTRFRGAVGNKPKPTNKGLTKEGGQPLGAGGTEPEGNVEARAI